MKIKINSEAINFFKINGFKQSKDIISTSQQPLIYCGDGAYFHINQLKKIVEAFDFVEYCNGLEDAKELLDEIYSERWVYNLYTNTVISVEYAPSKDMCIRYGVLKQAIELVEKCNES